MRYFIQLALSAIITCNIGYAENLKECQSKEDKIQGCVFKIGRPDGFGPRFEIPLKNGTLDGIEKSYYKNGNLKQETSYKNNVIDGIEKRYYENGDLIAEITYQNEKIIGGKCSDGKAFSNAHLHNLEKRYNIDSIIKEICEKP